MKMDKKGFFFVIVAFVLLSYILASTYIWVRAIEMEESRYSESFRTTSMEMLVDQLNEKSVSQMANVMSNYAFYKLDNYSIRDPVKPGGDEGTPEEFDNIKLAMRGLILNGSASSDYFEGAQLEYSEQEKSDYTLYGWGEKLNGSLSASGFELERFEIHQDSFVINQTDYLLYEVNFTMDLVIRDTKSGSATSLNRTYHVSTLVNATGMVDPYIARESIDMNLPHNQIAEKQMFMAPPEYTYNGRDVGYSEDYPSGYPTDPVSEEMSDPFTSLCSSRSGSCYYVESGTAGQGWFYGPMISVTDTSGIDEIINTGASQQYILVGNYSDIKELINNKGEKFGAYILTNDPTETDSVCAPQKDESETFNAITWEEGTPECKATIQGDTHTFVPFAVDEGFKMEKYIGDNGQNKVLFISQHSIDEVANVDTGDPALKKYEVAFYDVEMLRDFVVCGYYLPRSDSPSLLQRMFDIGKNPASMRPGGLFGIETTVAGQWAGGNMTPSYDQYSRVDVEFFGQPQVQGSRIMGMPGCKNVFFCTDDSDSDVGQFRISPDAFERYNLPSEDGWNNDNIACNGDDSGNGEHAVCDTNE